MKKPLIVVLFLLALGLAVSAQTLTIRDIMAEPSIAGMRVEGEKLAPDGTKVIYLWNPEGKMPRSLYLQSTSGGEATKLLSPSDLPPPTRPPERENKLNYGLELRDDFVKERENQLGNFEWSLDSRKLLFSHSGDLYVLSLDGPSSEMIESRWREVESIIQKRTDAIPLIVQLLRESGVQENELFGMLADSRSNLLKQITDNPTGLKGARSDSQKSAILTALASVNQQVKRIEGLVPNYPQLRSNERFVGQLDELTGNENRLNVRLLDYRDWAAQKTIKRLTKTQSPEIGARFLGDDRILFSQGGHAFVLNIADSSLTQLTREANPATFISVGNTVPNKSGTLLAYVVSDGSKQRQLIVPNYLPEFVGTGTPRRGWTEQKLFVTPTDGNRETPFEIKLPKSEGVSGIRRLIWAADNSSLIVDRVDKDTKRRQLFYVHNVGSKGEQIILITEETDDKWQASLSVIFESNPKKPGELFFGSERDGYNHLYLAKLTPNRPEPQLGSEIRAEGDPGFSSNVAITQLTKGNWQVEWAKWTPDGANIVFSSTEGNTAQRKFYSCDADRGLHRELGFVGDGMITNPQLAEQGEQPMLLFGFSKWNMPEDLYSMPACFNCRGISGSMSLTKTTPDAFPKRGWTAPKFVNIPSRDGKKIPAKIYLPPGHSAKQKYPMVIFVHGAGYLQNVINGWNNYYREFMFNHILTQKGYVVLDIDYRGSAGYGRDWRTDVYDFLGGKDYDDHIDAIDHMVKNYAVNPAKVGTYGGSYGGFMAGMLVMRAPDKIAAAAALRPVFDWKNYYAANPGYTAQRLGFPDKNPEAYKRSSPITYANMLERPLLILHGMNDDNVHVQDSIQLMEKLIRLGKTKYFEAMLYPSENHGFVRPESWTDEYERILAFFEKHLK